MSAEPTLPVLTGLQLALSFLTRLPVPGVGALKDAAFSAALGGALPWFPVVGALIGLSVAAVLGTAALVVPAAIAAVLALSAELGLTGALHEDGLADCCDGLGSGKAGADAVRIMKDSRIGAFGAIGLVCALGLRAACYGALAMHDAHEMFAGLIAASTLSRFSMVALGCALPSAPGQSGLGGAFQNAIGPRTLPIATVACLAGLAPMLLLAPLNLFAGLILAGAASIWLARTALSTLGGITGDVLGAGGVLVQLAVLVAACIR